MIADIHYELCPRASLLDARRALYRMALRLLMGDEDLSSWDLDREEVNDNPRLRFAVSRSMRAEGDLGPGLIDSVRELAAACQNLPHGLPPRIADGPDINSIVPEAAGYLELIDDPSPFLHRGDPEWEDKRAAVAAGADLARRVSPELAADLLAHVYACGVLTPRAASAIRSGSLREMSGLIAVSADAGPVEIAEMLLHEAAHQKLFDFMLVGNLLLSRRQTADLGFSPQWHSGTTWPVDQTLAAFHAYACLAEFAADLANSPHAATNLSPESLLPHAAERRDILGIWLLDHVGSLGPDAHYLVSRCLGRSPERRQGHTPANGMDLSCLQPKPIANLLFGPTSSPEHALVATAEAPFRFYFLDRGSSLTLKHIVSGLEASAIPACLSRELAMPIETARELAIRTLHGLGTQGLVNL